MNEVTATYEVYEDGKTFLGIAEIQLPNVRYMKQEITAAGIAGKIETIYAGFVDTMTTTMKFISVTKDTWRLNKPKLHRITIVEVKQFEDDVTGEFGYRTDKTILSLIPSGFDLGKLAPASSRDPSGEYITRALTQYMDGELFTDIDPIHRKCLIDGEDFANPIYAAI